MEEGLDAYGKELILIILKGLRERVFFILKIDYC